MLARHSRRSLGTTLTEVVVSSALLTGLMVFGIPVMARMGQAGDEGAARLSVSAANQNALLKMASELQNGSTTATDFSGAPRFAINPGTVPTPVVDLRNGFMGGFRGRLGSSIGEQVSGYMGSGPVSEGSGGIAGAADSGDTSGSGGGLLTGGVLGSGGLLGGVTNLVDSDGDGDIDLLDLLIMDGSVDGELAARGSGFRGGSAWGRARSAALTDRERLGAPTMRPRYAQIPTNDVLRFQKVADYAVVAGDVQIVWGSPITYRIEGNRLIREQDGRRTVLANDAVGLKVDVTDLGTVAITLVSQKQAGTTGRVQYQANQIEVSPKN